MDCDSKVVSCGERSDPRHFYHTSIIGWSQQTNSATRQNWKLLDCFSGGEQFEVIRGITTMLHTSHCLAANFGQEFACRHFFMELLKPDPIGPSFMWLELQLSIAHEVCRPSPSYLCLMPPISPRIWLDLLTRATFSSWSPLPPLEKDIGQLIGIKLFKWNEIQLHFSCDLKTCSSLLAHPPTNSTVPKS